MIPKIIHQTWKTKDIPDQFQAASASWRKLHPDWEYRLWSHDDLDAFVEAEFPQIWPLYKSYPEDIQRVDAARYMFLYRYGGLYSDLDIACNRPMDDFLDHEALMAPTKPVGLANDLMMAEPGHPFFKACIDSLGTSFARFNRFFILRHFRVLMTTGPLFVTRVHKDSVHRDRIFLMPGIHYNSGDKEQAYVLHLPGDTWAEWDTHMLNFLANNWKVFVSLGTALILGLLFLL